MRECVSGHSKVGDSSLAAQIIIKISRQYRHTASIISVHLSSTIAECFPCSSTLCAPNAQEEFGARAAPQRAHTCACGPPQYACRCGVASAGRNNLSRGENKNKSVLWEGRRVLRACPGAVLGALSRAPSGPPPSPRGQPPRTRPPSCRPTTRPAGGRARRPPGPGGPGARGAAP